jgi:hypothetical protein
MTITFSSCFYIIKSKFSPTLYVEWMNNFISIVNEFNLVIYTDQISVKYINTNENPKIKVVIKPLEDFYNYKYKTYWIENHKNNRCFNADSRFNTDWQLNMLWSEKVWFVNETATNKYFDTEFYGWCDIGYFRNRPVDLNTSYLSKWPTASSILTLDKTQIYYGCVNNYDNYLDYVHTLINKKNEKGLPVNPIPTHRSTVAGGFFILHKDKVDWWTITYNLKLKLYLMNNYLVKDDQTILEDCIFSQQTHFSLVREKTAKYDNWFMFQRLLMLDSINANVR